MDAGIQSQGCEAWLGIVPKSGSRALGKCHPWHWIPASLPE